MLTSPIGQQKAKVYLVGAGPGAADLLTVRAVRTLGSADVVLHDALVSSEILALIPSRARIVDVGKRCGHKSISQSDINELLIRYAGEGKIVIRLKSGDPLVFGRAGEELEALNKAGIAVEVVPGVTAALAAAASVQVPLTDRRSAGQVLFVSAHHAVGNEASEWGGMVHNQMTLVVYMPGNCAGLSEKLRRTGLRGTTPCAIVSKISSPEEHWYRTTLASLEYTPPMPSPSVLIVGEVLSTAVGGRIRALCSQSSLGLEGLTVACLPPA